MNDLVFFSEFYIPKVQRERMPGFEVMRTRVEELARGSSSKRQASRAYILEVADEIGR